ncbi:hypothetical protein [Streptomyces endophytica]|uniref:Uncharacterized protein n=1 Tax=Streptomyces endophytica TaxID=2991496 RepID=A0ABY6PKZ3_9ACTN|nr:hypothetical protein [Streptomyces endophytica]UZJ34277.1 hypothetical protein OJ254_15165 [Streptomyces endophytica]
MEVSARTEPGLVLLTMSLHTTAQSLVSLAAEPGHEGGHASLSPFVTGGGALFVLLLLLWVTTRFNRDR